MSSANAILRTESPAREGKFPIYIQVSIKRHTVKFSTGFICSKDNWDPEKQHIKGKTKEITDNNLIIDNTKSRIIEIFTRYRLQNRTLTPDLLRQEYRNPSSFTNFLAFIRYQIERRRGEVTHSTIKANQTMVHLLEACKPVIFFQDVNFNLIHDFQKYLKKKNMKPGTIGKVLSNLKIYTNLALRNKIITDNPFAGIPIRRPAGERTFLMPEELQSLVNLYAKLTLPENHQRVLRYFLFSCFTGLRISDLKKVKPENIVNGNTLIYSPLKTKYTAKWVKIPLTDPALKLIQDLPKNKLIGLLFNCYSDQVTNRMLKKIAAAADIDKDITSHTARHTFATIFLRETKNLAVLQKLMGHTNISETMIYAHILTEDLEAEMKIFNKFNFSGSSLEPKPNEKSEKQK